MKRLLPFILLSSLLTLSLQCRKIPIDFNGENCIDGMPDFQPEPTNNQEYDFRFFENSSLQVDEGDRINGVDIVPGDKLVFQYEFVKNDSPQIADDEYTEYILFEIPAGLDSFIISGEDLKKSNAVFGAFCFCANVGYFWIDNGCIKGERVNNSTWNIAINISAQAPQHEFTKMLSEEFEKD
jgi:hypothetical protein